MTARGLWSSCRWPPWGRAPGPKALSGKGVGSLLLWLELPSQWPPLCALGPPCLPRLQLEWPHQIP